MSKHPTTTEGHEDQPPSIRSVVLDNLAPALDALVTDLESRLPEPPEKPVRAELLQNVTAVVRGMAIVSVAAIVVAAVPPVTRSFGVQVALFFAVAFAPHWPVGWCARLAVALGEGLQVGDHKIGFKNPGAFLGIVERALFLGALVAGFPEFIAVWFVLKGIAGYRVEGPASKARRTFQLFLLNSAVSFAGVALGWLVWNLLGLPTWPRPSVSFQQPLV